MSTAFDCSQSLKSKNARIKKEIFQTSQNLGSGISNPVPYDTAWVARVPELKKWSPAFPDSLQWLRDHQTKDGSWGTDYPPSVHCKVLNTFAAVLALSQWSYPQDEDRIRRGVQALELMAKTLPVAETIDKVFEVIISGLLEEARELELNIAYTHFEFHSATGKEKLKRLEKGIMSNQPNSSWSLLEAAGGMELELECYRLEITQNGLIADQPATTAFILRYARMRNVDFPEAEWALEKLCDQNRGGVPHFSSCDNFETIHGLDFLFKAGINPRSNSKYGFAHKAINMLKQNYDSSNGIGFSSNWPILDQGCTDTAQRVLLGAPNDKLDVNKDKVSTKSDSYTIEADSFLFRSQFNPTRQLVFRSETDNDANEICFTDKAFLNNERNISLYHNILQQVFKTKKHAPDELLAETIEFIVRNQNSDGGWGGQCTSSAEDTAYVCLAVYRLIQTKQEIVNRFNFSQLVKFMDRADPQNHTSFWCHKVNFSSTVLSAAVSACAKYAVLQIQRLVVFAEALNFSGIEFLEVNYLDKKEKSFYWELLPIISPGEERDNENDIEVRKELVNACKTILGIRHLDDYMQQLLEVSLDLCWNIKNFRTTLEDRVNSTLIIFAIFLLDEYFDSFLKGKNQITEAQEVSKISAEVLRGHHEDPNTLPDFNFRTLKPFWRWLFYCRIMMLARNCNVEPFVSVWEKHGFFKYNVKAYEIKSNEGIKPTSKLHLSCHKHLTAVVELAHYYALLVDSDVDLMKFECNEMFRKFRDCASKAGRIMFDVFGVQKDVALDDSDNYCLVLMKEYKISLAEAMRKATKKANKEILKMYSLKKVLLENSNNEENKKLALVVEYVERYVNATIFWGMTTPRYQLSWKMTTKKLSLEKVDLRFCWEFGFQYDGGL